MAGKILKLFWGLVWGTEKNYSVKEGRKENFVDSILLFFLNRSPIFMLLMVIGINIFISNWIEKHYVPQKYDNSVYGQKLGYLTYEDFKCFQKCRKNNLN